MLLAALNLIHVKTCLCTLCAHAWCLCADETLDVVIRQVCCACKLSMKLACASWHACRGIGACIRELSKRRCRLGVAKAPPLRTLPCRGCVRHVHLQGLPNGAQGIITACWCRSRFQHGSVHPCWYQAELRLNFSRHGAICMCMSYMLNKV